MVRRWGLTLWVLSAVLLFMVSMLTHPVLRTDVLRDAGILLLLAWAPMLMGGVLTWILVRSFGDRDRLDRRLTQAMDGHPIKRELAWLILFLVCFVLAVALLALFFRSYGAQMGAADLAMAASLVARLLFLFTLPLLVMDRSGITVEGKGTAMPTIALKVSEPWRWLGLVPIALSLGLIGYLTFPYIGLPGPSFPLVGFLLAFIVIAVCEEIFYRGMVQSRMEILTGRWGGIVSTSVIFALTYAVIQPYDAVAQLPGPDLVYHVGLALVTYGVAGLFYGYLWTCFRNTWLQVSMRVGVFLVLMPPDLQVGL